VPAKHAQDTEQQGTKQLLHMDDSAAAQIIGIAILEFGVLLHKSAHPTSNSYGQMIASGSILIGLTLAVDEGFKVLFVVIVFHRTPLCIDTA
jgi:zinc transporter 1/2/3